MYFAVFYFIVLIFFGVFASAQTYSDSAFSIQGEVKYKKFKYFDYVNPNAPKGGHIKQYALGSYDNFYDFLPKRVSAKGLRFIYDTLMVRSLDEPNSQYGLIAKQVQRAKDNTFVIFHLDENARFNDGKEITAFDVEFSFKVIARGGNPSMESYYADVKDVIVVDKHTVRFNFKDGNNRELALILGDLPILPKHAYENVDFHQNPLRIPLGSGPYEVESFEAGQRITYRRVEKYWAKNHPTRVGHFNFDKITINYYQNDAIALEAFKKGEYDFREEMNARNWILGYNGSALKEGDIQKQEFLHFLPSGMQGFVFNVRKSIFSDRRVREAIGLAFDFEWSNKNLFYNQYIRTKSFFDNSEYASVGVPLGAELELLEPFRDQLPSELFTQSFPLSKNRENGSNRENLKKAQLLLKDAGYSVKNGRLEKNGIPFEFELLLVDPAMQPIAISFQKQLQSLGIKMHIALVDVVQYASRLHDFDYEMVVGMFPQSLSPGNEQAFFWGSEVADKQGSYNYIGVKNDVVDALITKVIHAKNHKELLSSVRALDRVLLWEYYVIPHFHIKTFRVAFWRFLEHPKITPLYGVGFETWWMDSKKLQEIQDRYPNFRR